MPGLFTFFQAPLGARLLPRLFFSLVLLLGLLLHRDYGLSWDEPIDHLNGLVNAKYIARLFFPQLARQEATYDEIPDFENFSEHDHGVLFALPVAVLGRIFTHGNTREFYFLQHLLNYLTCTLGMWALYRIGLIRFKDWRWALLGSLLLLLSPRFFAESFYNSKDLIFMAFFTVAIYTLLRLLENPTISRALVHGLATAAAIDVRIMGLMVVVFTLGMLGLAAFARPISQKGRLAQVGGAYLLAASLFTVLGWPYLWANPWGNLVMAFQTMSHFRWEGPVLYWGQLMMSTELPWHYAPVWIFITTPLAYTMAFLGAVVALITGFSLRRLLTCPHYRYDVLFLGWAVGPIVAVVGLHSVLYDGWRHLYFLYPALLLLAVQGVRAGLAAVEQQRGWRPLAVVVASLGVAEMALTLTRMVQDHPFQNVYFSCLPGPVAEKLFDRDYWALSNRQGVEWLLAHDPSPRITLETNSANPIGFIYLILPRAESSRLSLGGASSRYFLTNYREYSQPYPAIVGREVYTIRASGAKILSIFQRY
ncbi:glycosyltransferase family 39 protein [Hymenobacter sp. BT730]|uniref:glycosyltransferase family 39 protein n=1 Tax=Hymenobacter sp. BT730 TaxID=3063332 RepID=UPI0026E06449|nr:glycosyltransferase family 39 protein [Hymenobacter sp. BT730]